MFLHTAQDILLFTIFAHALHFSLHENARLSAYYRAISFHDIY